MKYKLDFYKSALKEWNKLDEDIRNQFKKKLTERLEEPRIDTFKLSGMKDHYKIKLRQSGYRLVYKVEDDVFLVAIVAVGKREKNTVYKSAIKRI